jgi:hypothetical protein
MWLLEVADRWNAERRRIHTVFGRRHQFLGQKLLEERKGIGDKILERKKQKRTTWDYSGFTSI